MSVFRTLAAKPWLSSEDIYAAPVPVEVFNAPPSRVGLSVFFAVVGSLFMLFIVGYRLRMVYEDWVPLAEPAMLWLNTGFLVLASIALDVARRAAKANNRQRASSAFFAGGICSWLFIAGQLLVWLQLSESGHFVSTNPASSFFYLLTGIHGLHILGGLIAWVRVLGKLKPAADMSKASLSIALCASYWHFLLFIWCVLFYLLSVT